MKDKTQKQIFFRCSSAISTFFESKKIRDALKKFSAFIHKEESELNSALEDLKSSNFTNEKESE